MMLRLKYLSNARAATVGTLVKTDTRLFFRDANAYIYSSASGQLDLVGKIVASGARVAETGHESYVTIQGYMNAIASGAAGQQTRGLLLNFSRTSGHVLLHGDAGDQALMIRLNCYEGGHAAGYFIRAMDVQSQYRAAGKTLTALYGGSITAFHREGTIGSAYVLNLCMKNNGVCSGDFVGLRIISESQGTISGDDVALQITTSSINPATGAVTHAIEIEAKNTSGFTNLFHFGEGTNGYDTVKTGAYCDTNGHDSDGAIRVLVNDTAYYIPIFNASHTSSSW